MKNDELSLDIILDSLKKRDPHQEEFHQAVSEVFQWIIPFAKTQKKYNKLTLFEQLTEPERIIQFKVPWTDDNGETKINRGWRVQFNGAIGPYKGGIRFHPGVTISVLKFLAFEQCFKNSLTGLQMGGAKGGSDFDPKGKSDAEILQFCQSFMTELHHYIGPEIDIPAGDIGVGSREVAYLFGQYRRLTHRFNGTLTGKGISFGGSKLRPEATGFGLIYFTEMMLQEKDDSLDGAKVLISGSGNVAQYACMKALELGAEVLSMSDSGGYIYVENGLTKEQLEQIMELKNERSGRLKEAPELFDCEYHEGKPWGIEADVALPCATQNELNGEEAGKLVNNGIRCVAEGANMPCTPEAIKYFHETETLYAPGKASNAGGVAVSGLEMAQNHQFTSWTEEKIDEKLREMMQQIHRTCAKNGKTDSGYINYEKGAAIAGFRRLADAILMQGGF
ncbi:MAG: NADP-specific glutamate dehydrogenase [Balneolales bacterium]|nr:NADP-specific glutamate dehydrogenase [Balneolales bacterium]